MLTFLLSCSGHPANDQEFESALLGKRSQERGPVQLDCLLKVLPKDRLDYREVEDGLRVEQQEVAQRAGLGKV